MEPKSEAKGIAVAFTIVGFSFTYLKNFLVRDFYTRRKREVFQVVAQAAVSTVLKVRNKVISPGAGVKHGTRPVEGNNVGLAVYVIKEVSIVFCPFIERNDTVIPKIQGRVR